MAIRADPLVGGERRCCGCGGLRRGSLGHDDHLWCPFGTPRGQPSVAEHHSRQRGHHNVKRARRDEHDHAIAWRGDLSRATRCG